MTEDDKRDWSREQAEDDYWAWAESEQGAGRLLDSDDDFVADSRSELAAEDEYVAAGTGPLAGEEPVTLADFVALDREIAERDAEAGSRVES